MWRSSTWMWPSRVRIPCGGCPMMPQGRLVHPATAAGPGAGISAVHFLETRPVPLALVLQHPQKVAPTCIAERTGQTPVPHHATDMQGFVLHHGTSLGYRTGGLVVAVLPDMLHAGMESTAELIETVAVLGLPGAVYLAGTGDGLVHTPELGQGCLQGSGIRIQFPAPRNKRQRVTAAERRQTGRIRA